MADVLEILSSSELAHRAGSPSRARTLVRSGAYRQVLRGAYVMGAEDEASAQVRAAALRRVLPGDVALSHRSALWLLGEDVLGRDAGGGDVLDVTVPRGRHLLSRPGVRTHTADLPEGELVAVHGQLCVSVARAVVDVARGSSLAVGVAFGDRALRTGTATLSGVEAVLDGSRGLRGVRRARETVALLDGRSESWMESVLRVSLHAGGMRDLDVQYDVYDLDGHVGRADLHLDGVWIEYDGRGARLLKPVFVAERRRQTRALELGFQVRRFTSDDVLRRSPASLVAEVRRAAALAASQDRGGAVRGPDTLRPPRAMPLPTLAQLRRSA